MLRVLLIDNFDSFTYNLVQLLRASRVEHTLQIVSNEVKPSDLTPDFDSVLISPGPGLPGESGYLMQLIDSLADRYPVLGVCLGHQALAMHFGANLKQLHHSFHGERKLLHCNSESRLFSGLPEQFYCGRYHSWVVNKENFPDCLRITATDEVGSVMAFEHLNLPVWGVQFHPESYMTEFGLAMIRNWLHFQIKR